MKLQEESKYDPCFRLDYPGRFDAGWSQRLLSDCHIVQNVIDVLSDNRAISTMTRGNTRYLVAAALAQPASGTFGVQRGNVLRNPGLWNVDVGLRKNFPAFESQLLQFRWEIFDLLNHPNWNGPNADPTSGSLGLVTSKTGNRVMQLALKYIF